jgi:hypothetical protein
MTFSLLPDCLSSRLPGSLAKVEVTIAKAEEAVSQEAAAEALRPELSYEGSLAWLRRRVLPVRLALAALVVLMPDRFGRCDPTLRSFRRSVDGSLNPGQVDGRRRSRSRDEGPARSRRTIRNHLVRAG